MQPKSGGMAGHERSPHLGCSYSSRDSSLSGVSPLFLSLTHLFYVGRNKQACSVEAWKVSATFGDLLCLPAACCVNLQSA